MEGERVSKEHGQFMDITETSMEIELEEPLEDETELPPGARSHSETKCQEPMLESCPQGATSWHK